ncbi:MAG: hypothetical protein HY272_11410 [Gammaproteobacteria bacterium]|nr:hypothetical protein [Gammaproteobacteria bacterium]
MEIFSIALSWLVPISILLTLAVIWCVKEPNTPRITVFISGALLIAIAAMFLGMFEGLAAILANKYNETGEIYLNYKVAALIVPFYSAAIGTNLITHAITEHAAYAKAPSTKFLVNETVLLMLKVSLFPISIWLKPMMEKYVRDHEEYKKYLEGISKKKPWS